MSSWREEHEAKLLRERLDALFRPVLPHQWVDPAITAVLSEASPMVTPAAHRAAIKRETDWQRHIGEKLQRAEAECSRLRQMLDHCDPGRVSEVQRLTAGMYPSKSAKHDDDCHKRHAACLAVMVRHALLGEDA